MVGWGERSDVEGGHGSGEAHLAVELELLEELSDKQRVREHLAALHDAHDVGVHDVLPVAEDLLLRVLLLRRRLLHLDRVDLDDALLVREVGVEDEAVVVEMNLCVPFLPPICRVSFICTV